MKRALVLIALLAVLFIVVLSTHNTAPQPSADGTNANPPSWAGLLADMPFAPQLDLKTASVALAAAGARSFAVPVSSSKARIGRFSLSQGNAAIVAYDCGDEGQKSCRQTQCLTAAGVPLPPGCTWLPQLAWAGCDAKNFNARGTPGKARISALASGGTITICAPLGPATVAID